MDLNFTWHWRRLDVNVLKQGGQEALNRSPEFCLKFTNRYLLKAGHVPGDTWGGAMLKTDHVPGDTWGGAYFGPRGILWTNLVEVY